MKHNSLVDILVARFADAIASVAETSPRETNAAVRSSQEARFGDYQCNAAMGLAKRLHRKPREIAEAIIAAVKIEDIAEPLEVAGPGFINVRLRSEFLSRFLNEVPPPPSDATDDRLGMPPVGSAEKVVIDYSSPNVAKQMHVGHLRSTIIGDVIARVLGFEGHDIVRQNHVGDWGTQFGILIVFYGDRPIPSGATHDDPLAAIAQDYRAAQERFKNDESFANEARAAVGRLQSGDERARSVWRHICDESRKAFTDIYRRLNVLLDDDDVCGESFYNDRLAAVIEELTEKLPSQSGSGAPAELREHDGALCVYCYDEKGEPRFKKADGDELPMIVRKSDGAFLYATTDLAAIRYRIEELGARRLIYVTDARQKLHFQMFFAAARAIGWASDDVRLEHVTFGSVLGADRKPFKAREGDNIALSALLDEAVQRAYQVFDRRDEADADQQAESKRPELPETEKREIARRVGIAAVKYADLSHDRNKDYVFSWERMLAMQGNTAPYMMYAYARIRSIYRKAAERFGSPDVYAADVAIKLDDAAERALALRLARFRETIDVVASDLAAHTLCGYLYDTASDFMRFYEVCPVIKAPDETTRLSRMRLCDLTARTLRLGLALLGIEVIERM